MTDIPRTKLFIDTEFNDYKGALISMALVTELEGVSQYVGRFYEALDCPEPSEWVAKHVMPFIHRRPIGLPQFQRKLKHFLTDVGPCEIIADWPDDIRHFCDVLITGPGTCIDTPPLSFRIVKDVEYKSAIPHQALSDAIALRQWCHENPSGHD